MRKTGIVAGILVAILLIALAVRSQLRRAQPAEAAAPQPADTSYQETLATQPAPQNVIIDTATSSSTPPASVQQRPVVSDKLPAIEQPAAPQDEASAQQGATVLKRASAAYSTTKSMRADFVQRRENPLLNSTIVSRGTLFQRDPDRFALKFSQPAGDLIVGDGRYFWLYYPSVDRKQVLRAPAGQGAGAVDLQSQFIGDPLTRFTHVYHGTQKMDGRTVHVLTLTPRRDAGYQTLKVWVDGTDYLVRRFQITEPTGTLVEFQLNNLTVNPALGNDLFRFTPPAGATIIER